MSARRNASAKPRCTETLTEDRGPHVPPVVFRCELPASHEAPHQSTGETGVLTWLLAPSSAEAAAVAPREEEGR
jgi:hypothetical protein